MSTLPRVAPLTRERIAREFDDRGPEVCRTEIALDLEANNPEILDMATRCARDVGEFTRVMTGFCMFYRVLTYEARAAARAASAMSHAPGDTPRLSLLPRVSAETRAHMVRRIDSLGSQGFTNEVIADLERFNPELLQTAHNFAEEQADYGGVMQGFALLYACLYAEGTQERGVLH
jgi:hypothetical protein